MNCVGFSVVHVSQGSVATYVRCGEMTKDAADVVSADSTETQVSAYLQLSDLMLSVHYLFQQSFMIWI